MREIKFRGKRIDNGEWVYGSLLISEQEGNLEPLHYYIVPIKRGYYRVIPETVGQYTGLKDKNGKEIYEGDIIEIIFYTYDSPHCSSLFKITYEGMGFIHEWISGYTLDFAFCEEWIEVGNIHDNKELLEVD